MATPPDFTAGQVLTAAQMNAVGLWLTKTVTIGTTVSSVSVTDCFTTDYLNYRVVIGSVEGSTNLELRLQLTGLTSASYNNAVNTIGAGGTTVTNVGGNSMTYVPVGRADGGTQNSCVIDITGPFSTRRTGFMLLANGDGNVLFGGSQAVDANSRTGFSIATSTGTITGGTIKVYGYRN